MNNFPISQLRKVSLFFRDPENPVYGKAGESLWMHESQVDTYVAAKVELHHSPGVNPHIKDRANGTAPLWYIEVEAFRLEDGGMFASPKAYWHTTPGLGVGVSDRAIQENGAKVMQPEPIKKIWMHPEYIETLRREYED